MSVIEIEVKFRLDENEVNAVRAKLNKNFILVKKAVQSDIYFTHPKIDFSDRVFRLRKENSRVILTYKGSRISHNLKVREELEVEISEFNKMRKILSNLGFVEIASIKKIRETYLASKNTFVNFDNVKGLGYFIEIEMITDTANLDSAMHIVRNLASFLGLNYKKALNISYFELLRKTDVIDFT